MIDILRQHLEPRLRQQAGIENLRYLQKGILMAGKQTVSVLFFYFYVSEQELLRHELFVLSLCTFEQGIFHANRTAKCLRNQGRTKGEGCSTAN